MKSIATLFVTASLATAPLVAQEAPTRAQGSQSRAQPDTEAVSRTSRPTAAPTANAARSGSQRSPANRVELEATQITGNRELPRVLHIVPWKRADLESVSGKPAGSLIDQVLTPVDREVFRRETRYYEALKPDAAPPQPGSQGTP